MLSEEKIARMSESTNKAKAEGPGAKERVGQQELRKEYLEALCGGIRHHIEEMKIVDQEGTNITPERLKKVQHEKGLHSRK